MKVFKYSPTKEPPRPGCSHCPPPKPFTATALGPIQDLTVPSLQETAPGPGTQGHRDPGSKPGEL